MNSTIDLNMVNAYIPGRADVSPATAADRTANTACFQDQIGRAHV